ncbi:MULTISPECIES: KleE stable inheritance protein [Burkholderia]|uniref:KleE stable inheritance protein n=1 Tax=Burkholderia TaxID=32008 RepID=UPI00097BAEED|nr:MULTISPECIES: KleE stable inheritance protein [Burkholderia]VTY37620.1 Uncharacterised protein [Xylophilus ampelinus]AQQ20726.1 protein kleE [Burkholderia cenocepacia]ONJ20481.1 protein kleE [Burkholderia cenocepacia]ONN77598.1 protein kleE [Burkholderia cenocepacia]ONN78543.1 protein kleE [Burkholderia cenocepacia]
MSNVINFPKKVEQPAGPAPVKSAPASVPGAQKVDGHGLLAGLVKFVWMATVLVWPILRWVVSLEVLFQLLRMFYHWRTPGVHAGWTFLLHFAVLTALTYFVSVYRPKGV